MTTIHMETEKVHIVAKKLDSDAAVMLSSLHQAQSSASRLRFVWQGGDAEDFNNEFNQLIKNIENQVVVLQNLSVRVSREVDEWITVDNSNYSGGMRLPSPNPSGVPNASATLIGNAVLGGSLLAVGFDWGEWTKDFFDKNIGFETALISDFAKSAKDLVGNTDQLVVETGFSSEAFNLSNQAHELSDEADNLDHFGDGLGAGVSIGEKLLFEHKSLENAVLSTGLSVAIGKGLGYLIPGFGEVMLVNAGVQLAGNVAVGVLAATGNQDLANSFHTTLDAVDLGGYVDDISDGISDWLLEPGHPNPFGKVNERISEVSEIANALVTPVY